MGAVTRSSEVSSRPAPTPRSTPSPRRRRRGHQTSPRERLAVVLVAIAAGVVAAFAPASPSAVPAVDVVLRGATAAVVTLAASRARRWTWLVLAGLATAGAPEGVWMVVSGAGLVLAVVASLIERHRLLGACVGALSIQGLLRLSDVGFAQSSALLVALAVAPVLLSAYLVSPRRVRRKVHWTLAVLGGAVLVIAAAWLVTVTMAYTAVQRGAREAAAGFDAVADGRTDLGAQRLRSAASEFDGAHRWAASPLARPALAVPVLAQQARAVEVVTAEGARVATASADLASTIDLQSLKYTDGRLDVERLRDARDPLEVTARTMEIAGQRVRAVRSPWLLGPLAERVDEFDGQVASALPGVELAALASREGPSLLGLDGTRHYLVLFTQPAESRGIGGFVGAWAELSATDGRVERVRSGKIGELNSAPGRDDRSISSPPVSGDYMARYSRFRPAYFMQDVTLSPDMGAVADVVGQLYPQTGGTRLDGVMVVDPYAMAALMNFTGPVKVDGLEEPLTAATAADFLVRDQYVRFAGEEEVRGDVLADVGTKVFDALVKGSLPAPRRAGETLAPMVRQGRLLFHPFDAGEISLARRLGVDPVFEPPRSGGDFFQLVTQNKGNNKIDSYLKREVEYEVDYSPGSGSVVAKAHVTLRNTAPATGLPDSVIGSNDQGLPPGTNAMYLSFYSRLGLREVRVGDKRTPVEFQRENGLSVYSTYVSIPPGATQELEFDLFGEIAPSSQYRLLVGNQPLVNRDRVRVVVRPTEDWEVWRSRTLSVDPNGTQAASSFEPSAPTSLEAEVRRP